MEIAVKTGDIKEIEADAIIVGFYEDAEQPEGEAAAVDAALGGVITQLAGSGEIKGKLGEITVIHSLGNIPASRVAVLGLGKRQDVTPDRIRGAVGEVCRLLQQKNAGSIAAAVLGDGVSGINNRTTAQVMTEGALLGTYSFRKHITKEAEHGEIERLTIVTGDESRVLDLEKGCDRGKITADAAILARDMVNEPANFMTPADMAEMAEKVAGDYGLEVEVIERERMKELGMGALLGVAQGSQQPPKLISMKYSGGKRKKIDVAIIGKAITFDSGGISIKPSSGMEEMKGDMAGGAAVIAAMGAIARLKPAINVLALIPATENLPSGGALKPGDVLTAMGGKTIEIISTDAEGRLALADAIGYARKQKAKRIVDTATLTGAMQVSLGDVCTGAFANDQELADKVIAAGDEAGERIWQMPMYDDYKELNKSEVADIKNVGGRLAGSITAAQFLAEFVGDVPWVHLDIAGTFMADKNKNYLVKGATGVPVRTLINLVANLAES